MNIITGKTLIFTDIHFGLKSDSNSRLKICVDAIKNIKKYITDNKIENVIFLGDWFHNRNVVNVQTLDVAYRCLESIAKLVNFYFILGNHDIFLKSDASISSANVFKNIKNVKIISSPEEYVINGKKTLLAPWFSNLANYKKNEFDMMMGHFDICSDYLIASYIEDNSHRLQASDKFKDLINNDDLLKDSGLDNLDFSMENVTETIVNRKNSSELIGDWVEIVKEKGLILSGHIHNRKNFYTKKRNFIFVGSPYQQTIGEMTSEDGFYVIDTENNVEFHPLNNLPKYIDVKISEIVKDIDGYDYSIVKNNIVHKIYDIEVDRVLDAKITQKIIDNKPYEEVNPDYLIKNKNENSGIESDETIDLIRKSRIDYLRNYIKNIDDKVINENQLTKDTLIKTITEYYDRATEL